MPPAREYTPARRKMMQGVLWIVLAGSVGLAAVVDHQLLGSRRASLGPELIVGALHIRLPVNWIASRLRSNLVDPLVLEMAEPDNAASAGGARIIRVYSQLLRRPMSPDQYLDNSGLLDDVSRSADFRVEQTTLAGRQAVLVVAPLEMPDNPDGNNPEGMQAEIVLCGILNVRHAVTLKLLKDGPITAADRVLMNSVASTVRIERGP